MLNYIIRTVALLAGAYVVFLGLAMIGGVLQWAEWDTIWDFAGKVGLVALIVLAINVVIAALVGVVPKADANKKK
ncbi:MAG: hypothetical protein LBL84_01580 [Candidatus Nomurabacteria bacterium]|jgi:hypothetical protein|nr:hypothetical protein [Candidatus Nomurabacteria bacterium]